MDVCFVSAVNRCFVGLEKGGVCLSTAGEGTEGCLCCWAEGHIAGCLVPISHSGKEHSYCSDTRGVMA